MFLLLLQSEIEKLFASDKTQLEINPSTSYHRMLAHRGLHP